MYFARELRELRETMQDVTLENFANYAMRFARQLRECLQGVFWFDGHKWFASMPKGFAKSIERSYDIIREI